MTNPASLKELIPEFYEENTDFLLNIMEIEFGLTSNNEKINVTSSVQIACQITSLGERCNRFYSKDGSGS